MARIPCVEIESAPRVVQEILRAGPRNTRNIQGLIAHASGNLSGLSAFLGSVLTAQALDPRLRELAILRVAYLTGAEYEWTQHTTLSAPAGVSPAQLAAIAEGRTEGTEFSQDEATLLAFVSQFIETGHPDVALFGRTRSFLSDREIVELLLAAGAYWALGRLMTALEIDAEPPMDEADAATLLASFPSAQRIRGDFRDGTEAQPCRASFAWRNPPSTRDDGLGLICQNPGRQWCDIRALKRFYAMERAR